MTDETQTPTHDRHAATIARDSALFNALPYESYPYAASHPDTLATLATLLGRDAPAVDRARVLELGCASGGNLIPLAARFGAAEFLGIDLAERHIEDGSARIEKLGLTNIALKQGDLLQLDLGEAQYDYILCHGVYSWVDPATQQAILALMGRHLAPSGIAYVSYNVLPGWQQRSVIRDIFAFSDTGTGTAPERVERGRWLLEQLAKASDQDTPYGQMLRREATTLSQQGDSYLMSEFLVQENKPSYFHDLAKAANAEGLAYLCEASLADSLLDVTNPQLDQIVRALSGPDDIQYEQFYDFLRGRQFRQSLLVRSDGRASAKRKLTPARLTRLHFSSRLRPMAMDPSENAEPGAMRLREPSGRSLTTNDPVVIAAFDHMGAQAPSTVSWSDAVRVAAQAGGTDAAQPPADRLAQAILKLTLAGLCRVSTQPTHAGRGDDPHPKLTPLARQELVDGQTWVTGADHAPVRLEPAMVGLALMFDGSRDTDALTRAIGTRLADGSLPMELAEAAAGDSSLPLDQKAAALCHRFVQRLGTSGVLSPRADA